MPIALRPGEFYPYTLEAERERKDPTVFHLRVLTKEEEARVTQHEEIYDRMELALELALDHVDRWCFPDGTDVGLTSDLAVEKKREKIQLLAVDDRWELYRAVERRTFVEGGLLEK